MIEPAKNRLHDYEAGWLTLLVSMRVATEAEARAAMSRVARKAIDDMEERRAAMDEAVDLVASADVLLVVGTSLQVYPAAGLVFEAPKRARRIVVNPDIPGEVSGPAFETVAKPATIGVPEVVADLLA